MTVIINSRTEDQLVPRTAKTLSMSPRRQLKTTRNKQKRFVLIKKLKEWTLDQWKSVLCSDLW